MRIETRSRGFRPTPALCEHTERRLRFALGRFGDRVSAIRVRLRDVNGPRGGPDKECRLHARLAPSGAVEVSECQLDVYAAIDGAAERLSRAVARELDRRRELREGRVALQYVG